MELMRDTEAIVASPQPSNRVSSCPRQSWARRPLTTAMETESVGVEAEPTARLPQRLGHFQREGCTYAWTCERTTAPCVARAVLRRRIRLRARGCERRSERGHVQRP